jgi:hypothetical protein
MGESVDLVSTHTHSRAAAAADLFSFCFLSFFSPIFSLSLYQSDGVSLGVEWPRERTNSLCA